MQKEMSRMKPSVSSSSSALSYGSNLLKGDMLPASGNGPFLAWNNLEVGSEAETVSKKAAGNLSDFLRLISEDGVVPSEAAAPVVEKPIRQKLGVDLPLSTSPGGMASARLPQMVLQMVATSLQASVVVVAVLHPSNRLLMQQQPSRLAETVIATAPVRNFPEAVSFSHDVIVALTGEVVSTATLNLSPTFEEYLGAAPVLFQGRRLRLDEYEGVIYALWTNARNALPTAARVMVNAARSLPLLLASRMSARKSERLGRQFDAILKRMPQAVVFVDDELAQVVVNPAAAELLELPCFGEVDPVKVAGSMRQLAERSGSRSDLQRWFSMVAGTANSVIEEEWQLSEPRRVLRVQSYPVSSSVNAAHGRLWLFEDLTAERDAREAITAANLAKSQFLAMMSHELRTPMTGVLGMLDLLKLTHVGREQRQLLKVMQTSAEGLMTVINNILDFCKMEAGRLTLEEIDFNAGEILEQVGEMFARPTEEKEIELKIQKPLPGHDYLRGDPVRLKQILINLVSNATKFTPDEGTISISWLPVPPPGLAQAHLSLGRTASAPAGPWGRPQYVGMSEGVLSMLGANMTSGSPQLGGAGGAATASGTPGSPFNHSGNSSPFGMLSPLRDATGAHPPNAHELRRMSTMPANQIVAKTGGLRAVFPSVNPIDETTTSAAAASEGERRKVRGEANGCVPSMEVECSKCGAYGFWEPARSEAGGAGANGAAPAGNADEQNGLRHSEDGKDRLCPKCQNIVDDRIATAGGATDSSRPAGEGQGCDGRNQEGAWTGEGARPTTAGAEQPADAEQLTDAQPRGEEGEAEEKKEDLRQWYQISVQDSGCGMTQEQLLKAFEATQTTLQQRAQEGTGLGLAICRGLLNLMGGRITVESEVGVGSKFSVLLPLDLAVDRKRTGAASTSAGADGEESSERTEESGSTSEGKKASSGPKVVVPVDVKMKVLVAEDNKVNQLLIRKILKHYGHEVVLVGNGKLALEAVQKDDYDLVLMDLQMPIMDGLTATRAIRALDKAVSKIPIYALTADAMGAEIEEAGMDGFLSKPIVWEKMSHVVDQILEKKAEKLGRLAAEG
eukprot:TRINITY_DN21528_c0_g1_i1.p1 TRINITY_DN21528_c0_g1~~TRINITY_DN21528_c0_g1_i1.p1  ORF type:complete len:1075 (-),score=211.17 TRINITY_DN21528_c0_g1_i1:1210-4434(-)